MPESVKMYNPGKSAVDISKLDPVHDKTYKIACVSSEDLDQPGHPPSRLGTRPAWSEASLSA